MKREPHPHPHTNIGVKYEEGERVVLRKWKNLRGELTLSFWRHASLCRGGRRTSCSCQSRRRQGTRYTTPTTSKPRIEPRCTKECSEILNARKHGLSFSENSQGYRANSRLPGLLLQRRPTSSSAAFCTSVQHVPGNEI